MSTRTARNHHTAGPAQPEQLSLLRTSDLPMQFRLDRRTRERGLEHVAEIRRLLEAKHQTTAAIKPVTPSPSANRHDQAA